MDIHHLLFKHGWHHSQCSTTLLVSQTSDPFTDPNGAQVLSSQDAIPTCGAELSMDMLGGCGVASLVQHDVGPIECHSSRSMLMSCQPVEVLWVVARC